MPWLSLPLNRPSNLHINAHNYDFRDLVLLICSLGPLLSEFRYNQASCGNHISTNNNNSMVPIKDELTKVSIRIAETCTARASSEQF